MWGQGRVSKKELRTEHVWGVQWGLKWGLEMVLVWEDLSGKKYCKNVKQFPRSCRLDRLCKLAVRLSFR